MVADKCSRVTAIGDHGRGVDGATMGAGFGVVACLCDMDGTPALLPSPPLVAATPWLVLLHLWHGSFDGIINVGDVNLSSSRTLLVGGEDVDGLSLIHI